MTPTAFDCCLYLPDGAVAISLTQGGTQQDIWWSESTPPSTAAGPTTHSERVHKTTSRLTGVAELYPVLFFFLLNEHFKAGLWKKKNLSVPTITWITASSFSNSNSLVYVLVSHWFKDLAQPYVSELHLVFQPVVPRWRVLQRDGFMYGGRARVLDGRTAHHGAPQYGANLWISLERCFVQQHSVCVCVWHILQHVK